MAFIGLSFVGVNWLFDYVERQAKKHAVEREKWEHDLMLEEVARIRAGERDRLYFYDVPNPDRVLEQLEPLDGFQSVGFRHSPVTAAGIKHLIKQPNLRGVTFNALDESLVSAIAKLPHLESLAIAPLCCLSDGGVQILSSIPTVRSLTLSFRDRPSDHLPRMTDVALSNLSGCAQLRMLRLDGDWYSDEAVEALREALPDCQIEAVRFEKGIAPNAKSARQ